LLTSKHQRAITAAAADDDDDDDKNQPQPLHAVSI
jgi:hypothetical protein